jgi:hypothetical protein
MSGCQLLAQVHINRTFDILPRHLPFTLAVWALEAYGFTALDNNDGS